MMVMIMVTMMTTMTMREMFNHETNTITDTHVGNYEEIVCFYKCDGTNLLTLSPVLSLPWFKIKFSQFMYAVIIIFEKCFCHKFNISFIFIHFT